MPLNPHPCLLSRRTVPQLLATSVLNPHDIDATLGDIGGLESVKRDMVSKQGAEVTAPYDIRVQVKMVYGLPQQSTWVLSQQTGLERWQLG